MWLWCAVDADSKFVASWRVGQRDLATAYDFVHDLADRLARRVQLTSDGFKVYLEAVESAFNMDVDYAMLQKIYGADPNPEKRYSPAKILSSTTEVIQGNPDPMHISTSYVERLNWSVRTSMRRYTRLSNGFSRKLRNHEAAVALNYFAYNFVRIHRTLRTSPAMAAGVTARLWNVFDIVELLQQAESTKAAKVKVRRNLYGWRYWAGAIAVVLLLLGIGNAVSLYSDGVTLPRRDVELVVGLLSCPPLIVYHFAWKWRMRRKASK